MSEQGFKTLYSRFQRFARFRGMNEPDARDIAQTGCVAVWQKSGLTEEEALRYGLRVVRNHIVNHYRARKREITVAELPAHSELLFAEDTELKAVTTAEARSAVEILRSVLGPREFDVFVLREVWLLPHAEIAVALGISVSNARGTFSNARAKVERHRADGAFG
ncbi:RNA polymerase sigma factor [Streptomyces lycii]|nr:sigma-70 family RNA polymerase sigma factor [Streptomyces lycii]